MKRIGWLFLVALFSVALSTPAGAQSSDGWITLFDGKSLNGWKSSTDSPETFSVQDGMIVVAGERAHLYYVGPDGNASFKNFELKLDAMTTPGSNSGIYFHTTYQADGWPSKGYEVQVNNSHTDWRRTGGLYAISDVREAPAKDGEWMTYHIIVNGKNIKISVNGKQLVDYTEPDNVERPDGMKERVLSSGTIALQGHDPQSKVYYKNIMIRPLP